MENSKFKAQNSKALPTLFTFLIFNFSFAPAASAQISANGSFSLEKAVVAAGGGESGGGGFTVAGTAGQHAAGTSTQNGSFFQVGGFWTADRLAPTAASVSIGGKVKTSSGMGIRNAIVTLTDKDGNVRATRTGSFGNYHFTDVEVGNTYILRVQAKSYFFSNPALIVSVADESTGLDFTADR